MSIAAAQPAWPISKLLHDIRTGHDWLWQSMIAMSAGLIGCLALMMIDHRLFNGVNVWDKPAKFFLSLIVQLATVSWALSLMPEAQRRARMTTWTVFALSAAAWFEMAYMIFRAARGEASHFNDSAVFAQVMYGLMGLGSLTLTGTAFLTGARLWRHRQQRLMSEATAIGLMLSMVLATAAGGYMSAGHGHWVGGELSDAHGLGFFSWSTTGGDLRVAHFAGMHTAQIVPFAALSESRPVVYGVALIGIMVTAATFAMAVAGIPLFRG